MVGLELLFFSELLFFFLYYIVLFCFFFFFSNKVYSLWRQKEGKESYDGKYLMPILSPSCHFFNISLQHFWLTVSFLFFLHIMFSQLRHNGNGIVAPMLVVCQECVWSTFFYISRDFDLILDALWSGCSISSEHILALLLCALPFVVSTSYSDNDMM